MNRMRGKEGELQVTGISQHKIHYIGTQCTSSHVRYPTYEYILLLKIIAKEKHNTFRMKVYFGEYIISKIFHNLYRKLCEKVRTKYI